MWILVDNEKYGLPVWDITSYDKMGKILSNVNFNSRYEKVFYHNWMKITKSVKLPKDANTIKVSAKTNQLYSIDEVLIKRISDTILYKSNNEAKRFMYNNFIIEQK